MPSSKAQEFPQQSWQSFQKLKPINALLRDLPHLRSLSEWPTFAAWQDMALSLPGWRALGRNLLFTHEDKLGQRAKRKLPKVAGRTYEAAIMEKGEIPFRAHDLHDFFNAMIWLNFPLSKTSLHARAFEVQTAWFASHDRQKRCPLADRLTCFDEGGIIFEIPPDADRASLEKLIQSRDDAAKRELCRTYAENFTLFGHGMMEVMMKGNHGIYASCILLNPGTDSKDQRLARYLERFDESTPDHGAINVSWLIADSTV